jgi:hypothetical protein
MTNTIAVVPKYASQAKPGDAAEFMREAKAWLAARGGGELIVFDNSLKPRARALSVQRVLDELSKANVRVNSVAFFMHGLRDSIQTGHTCNPKRQPGYEPVMSLALALRGVTKSAPKIPLYACDAARDGNLSRKDDKNEGPGGDGGFADGLRDAMIALDHAWASDGWVDAHITPGHTTVNPNVRRFRCDPLPYEITLGMVGGDWIVDPRDRKLWSTWRKALGSVHRKGAFRLDFPLLSIRQIHEHLGG